MSKTILMIGCLFALFTGHVWLVPLTVGLLKYDELYIKC